MTVTVQPDYGKHRRRSAREKFGQLAQLHHLSTRLSLGRCQRVKKLNIYFTKTQLLKQNQSSKVYNY